MQAGERERERVGIKEKPFFLRIFMCVFPCENVSFLFCAPFLLS